MRRVGVDVGGTFTDMVALDSDGAVEVIKVPSTPGDPAAGLWHAIDAAPQSACDVLVHGTTVATNALLEHRGARVVFVTTAGFEDLLWLRRQDRAGLYDLALDHPPPLVRREDVVGVRERMGATGVLQRLDPAEVDRVVDVVRALAPQAVAVGLLFSFCDPSHEQALVDALQRAFPEMPVVASAELMPVFREYERFGTTTAEAFLRPGVGGYVERLATECHRRGIADVQVMASTGGTLDPGQARYRATSLALSGPAAGVEGARLVGEQLGQPDLLTLDMGGTSADASVVVNGEPLRLAGATIGGIPLALPNVLIETVGAGGGSIGWVDEGGALRVGPQSAGAEPGPACYGRGGTDATVTDAAVVLGWLDPAAPLASDLALDADAARTAVDALAARARLDPRRCAEGIVEVAVATMVRALRRVSVERGLDPRHMTLVPFGGAGPLFACPMADSLGITRIVVPPHPGVLSALGLATATSRVETVASLHRRIDEIDDADWAAAYEVPEAAMRAALAGASLQRFADCRYPGQGYEVTVPADDGPAAAADAFHLAHAARFGHADPARAVEIVNLRVIASRPGGAARLRSGGAGPGTLVPGTVFEGPVTIPLADSTVRIESGWRAHVHEIGALFIDRGPGAGA